MDTSFSYKHKLTDKIGFGKYRDLTVRDVLLKDLSYFTWLYYKAPFMFDIDRYTFNAFEFMVERFYKNKKNGKGFNA